MSCLSVRGQSSLDQKKWREPLSNITVLFSRSSALSLMLGAGARFATHKRSCDARKAVDHSLRARGGENQ